MKTKSGSSPLQLLAAVACSFLCWSCQPLTTEFVPPDAPVASPQGQLSEGDLIKVTFPGASDLNLSQKILANGTANLPIIGDVSAAGKRLGTFQKELEVKYRDHLTDPRVLVSLETPSAAIYVSGEVVQPGKVSLERPLTVLEAVMEAGGFTKFANRKRVVVVRNVDGKQKRYVRNLGQTLKFGESTAFYLQPYDSVIVQQSLW